jgi:hypothetical protein
MRKREVEKLLYRAVAEALGVETEELRKIESKRAAPAKKAAPHDERRVAA